MGGRTREKLISTAVALAMGVLFASAPVGRALAAPSVAPDADILSHSDALAAVGKVRAGSSFSSSLPADVLNEHLARLLQWVARSYAQSGQLHLLADAPDGRNGVGQTNARLQILQQTYWLQDNALYGAGALKQYLPPMGQQLSESWRSKWEKIFPNLCPDTQSGYVAGIVPAYERQAAPADARCRLDRPDSWQYFRMTQYPDPKDSGFDSLPKPIIGTDHPVDSQGKTQLVPIRTTAVRDLLKYGCLRQVMLGNRGLAQQMFGDALGQWDGNGFSEPRRPAGDMYYTRSIAFALICANALGFGTQSGLGHGVTKAALEKALWNAQSASGGIWTNYCAGDKCAGSAVPSVAKQTNEIAPLVLLAYGANIWNSTDGTHSRQ